jgi:hypothetical protein
MDEQRLDCGNGNVAGIEVAIVRGKRDPSRAEQPRTLTAIPVGGYGRTFIWRNIVY